MEAPERLLPYSDIFADPEEYIESLLDFVGSNDLLRVLCGGVHILDFFTSTPDLYSQVLPQDWRDFFSKPDIMDILDLLMREDLSQIPSKGSGLWRGNPPPPQSLMDYIATVRKHLLNREPGGSQCSRNRAVKPVQKLARHVAVGMNVKKVHEVGLFANYIDRLSASIEAHNGERITHLVDFGSGQNYLGRALASEPYNRNIVAIESKQANADRAKEYDVLAKLAVKEKLMRNKKTFRSGREGPGAAASAVPVRLPTPPPEPHTNTESVSEQRAPDLESPIAGHGKIQYVEHQIQDGNLQDVVDQIPNDKSLMVMSLHSCGNLVHHGLRSMIQNREVKAVAMVGCCYNLMTERLGPATYKLPQLRPTAGTNPRLVKTGEARDPHGFPMSLRLANHSVKEAEGPDTKGIKLNITSRMMAVQAPLNWGESDSESFFTRHFYRALLQRIFLDRGVVEPPTPECVGGVSPAGCGSGGTPIVIGSLRKGCYVNFVSYVRGALAKLVADPERGSFFREKMSDITDSEISAYEEAYRERRKHLCVIWSLMAFSACVVEAAIVVDRWLWLKEQTEVKEAWVEPVFNYQLSPRNLVVVGIKK